MQRSISLSGMRPIRRQRSSIQRSKSLQKSCHPFLEENLLFTTLGPFPTEIPSSSSYGAEPVEVDIDFEVGPAKDEPVISSGLPISVAPPSQINLTELVITPSMTVEEEILPINSSNGSIEARIDGINNISKERGLTDVAASATNVVSSSPCNIYPDEPKARSIVQSSNSFLPRAGSSQEQVFLEENVTGTKQAHTSILPNHLEPLQLDRPLQLANSVSSTSSGDHTSGLENGSYSGSPVSTDKSVLGIFNEISPENLRHQVVSSTFLDEHGKMSYENERTKEGSSIEVPSIDLSTIHSQTPGRSISILSSPPPNDKVQTDSSFDEEKNGHLGLVVELEDVLKEIHVVTEEVFKESLREPGLEAKIVVHEGQDLICFSPGAIILNSPQYQTLIDVGFERGQRDNLDVVEDLELSIPAQSQDMSNCLDSKAEEPVMDELCSDEESDSDRSIQHEAPARPIGRFSVLMPTSKALLTEIDTDISPSWSTTQTTKKSSVCSQEVELHNQLLPSSPISKKRKISTPLDRNPMAIKKLKQPFKCPLITEKVLGKSISASSSQPTAGSPASSSPTPLSEPQPMMVQRSRPLSFKPLTIRPTVQYQALRDKLGLCPALKDQADEPISDPSPTIKTSDLETDRKLETVSKRNPFVTLKASAPFVSPVTASSSSPAGKTSSSVGSVGKVTQREVAKLESKVQMIKQAIRLVKGEGKRQEDKQEELIVKWKDAGREISQLLWDEGGSDNPANNFQPLEPNPFSSPPPTTSSLYPSDVFSSFPRQSFFSDSFFPDRPLLPMFDHSESSRNTYSERERSLSLDSSIGSPSAYRPSRSKGTGVGTSARRQVRGYLETFDKAVSEREGLVYQSFVEGTEKINESNDGEAKEDEEKEEEEEEEEEEEKGWDIGKMLRTVFRTDPTLFGWNDSIVDWEE